MNIKDLKTNAGEHKVLCNLTVEDAITTTKKPYLKMQFDDGTKAMIMIWDNNPKFKEYSKFEKKKLLLVEATLKFIKVNSAGYDEYELKDIVVKTRPSLSDCVEIEDLKQELRDIIKSLKGSNVHELLLKLCEDKELLTKLFNAPVTEKSGYSFKGGLLAHIVRLCKAITALGGVYNEWNYNKGGFNQGLDTEFLIICAIFHDIGAINYYKFDNECVEKTFEGELLEISYISSGIIRDILKSSSLSDEQKIILEHAITSSRGTLSFGALNTPRTPEANVFHLLERIDTVMANFEFMKRISLGNEFQKLNDKQYCLVEFNDL